MAKKSSIRMESKPVKKLSEVTPDEAALNFLRSNKINFSESRVVHFYLYFPARQKAAAAEAELKETSFDVEIIEPSEGKEWLCLATKEIFPNTFTLTSIRKRLEKLAHKFDGLYDGWETQISPDGAGGFY